MIVPCLIFTAGRYENSDFSVNPRPLKIGWIPSKPINSSAAATMGTISVHFHPATFAVIVSFFKSIKPRQDNNSGKDDKSNLKLADTRYNKHGVGIDLGPMAAVSPFLESCSAYEFQFSAKLLSLLMR